MECITVVLFTQDNMAAPMRLAARPLEFLLYQQARSLRHNVSQNVIRNFSSGKSFWKNSGYGRKVLVAGSVAVAGVTLTALGQRWSPYWQTVHAASATSPSIVRPDIEPSRKVRQDIRVLVCMSCWTAVFHIQSLTRAPRFFFFFFHLRTPRFFFLFFFHCIILFLIGNNIKLYLSEGTEDPVATPPPPQHTQNSY